MELKAWALSIQEKSTQQQRRAGFVGRHRDSSHDSHDDTDRDRRRTARDHGIQIVGKM